MFQEGIKNVIVVSDYGYVEGGAGKIAQQTAIALKDAGLNVVFFCAVPPVAEELTEAGIECVCLGQADIVREKNRLKAVFSGINNKKAAKEFASLLDRFSSEDTVVHVHTWTKALSSSFFPVAKKKGFNVFITVHDYFLVCPKGGLLNFRTGEICERKPMSLSCIACNCDVRSYPQKLFRVLRQRKQNKNIRKSDNISYIFISDFAKKQFCRRYDKIPEDKRYFLQNPIEFDADRTRVACENNDEYLFVGRVSQEKGIRIFCEGVTKAGAKATVVGDGDLKEELEKQYPDIQFVGWKTKAEMAPYIQRARCLIFPSIWYETFGLTAMEGMAYGLPVLCSDVTATSDYVENGKNGILYKGTSADALCETIKACENNDKVKNMSVACFDAFDEEKYSLKKYTQKLIGIFNSLH